MQKQKQKQVRVKYLNSSILAHSFEVIQKTKPRDKRKKKVSQKIYLIISNFQPCQTYN